MSEKKRGYDRTIRYMVSHDMDWYFQYKGYIFHCASNGGIIPKDCRKITHLNLMKRTIESMSLILNDDELYINEEHIEKVVKRQLEVWEKISESTPDLVAWFNPGLVRELYLSSFIAKAKRGLIAWDRLYKEDEAHDKNAIADTYVLVAAPKEDALQKIKDDSDYQIILEESVDISKDIKMRDDNKEFTIIVN